MPQVTSSELLAVSTEPYIERRAIGKATQQQTEAYAGLSKHIFITL